MIRNLEQLGVGYSFNSLRLQMFTYNSIVAILFHGNLVLVFINQLLFSLLVTLRRRFVIEESLVSLFAACRSPVSLWEG